MPASNLQFPHRSIHTKAAQLGENKMTDLSWNTPYIHGADQEADQTSEVKNPNAVFSVYLGEREIEFTAEDFLQACWTDGFDSPCIICKEPFDLSTEPPVRLLGLGQHTTAINPLVKELPPPSIKNYHLRCLKAAKINFMPVSHPWHPSIAEAYALRTFNAKAAQTCYEVPIRTLLGVIRRFGPDYLLWHDYISIPQWQDDFRGTVILPQIFKIFEASGSAILHLGHEPPAKVMETSTLKMISENDSDLKRFFNAHLFTRLWPIVESERAGEAYIMDKEYGIMQPKFSEFTKQILDAVNADATTFSDRMPPLQWMHDLPLFIRERQRNKCHGYVYDMIADLGCRSFHDKFIGAAELLGILDYPTKLPTNTQDACLWLAEQQIKRKDLSPLLLRPSDEPSYEKAGWLKGHTSIHKNMWGWGIQTHPTSASPRVQEHSVHLELHLVGTITHEFSLFTHTDDHLKCALDGLSRLVISTGGSVKDFLTDLQKIDPASVFRYKPCSNIDRVPTSELNVPSSKIFIKTLGDLLRQQTLSSNTEESVASSKTFESIISLIALSASLPTPELDHFESLSPHQLHRQICDSSERNLVSVSCSTCSKQSIFRVEMWQKPKTEARLYLIPGLAYQYTAAGGVGIIMERRQIIGRARFCASSCDCNHSVAVTIT